MCSGKESVTYGGSDRPDDHQLILPSVEYKFYHYTGAYYKLSVPIRMLTLFMVFSALYMLLLAMIVHSNTSGTLEV